MPDPDLADLDAFVAVARARSFRGAARLKGMSASALSEALRRLEARLGSRLLNRTTRSVTPTEAGAQLLERIAPAIREIGSALEAVNGSPDVPAGTLRLNAPTVVARHILPSIVSRFLLAHPRISLEVENNDSFIDVLAEGFDAGIRYEESVERDMVAVPIGPRMQRYVLAASPAYLAARGVPEHPRDLLAHACIRHRFASRVTAQWEFERDGETIRIVPSGQLIATSAELEAQAAIAGLGLICTFEEYLAEGLATGALVPLLEDWLPPFSGPRLYYAQRQHMPPPLRAFIDFIKVDNG
ncbi:LysR family transcriptional regulator [Methylobacterium brachythecii]|uniref:DNA-binding transcriptional LysR family regulator n=1 Tax=Methylobacterium brachythecii TaxID=1176177 RepID=A0A7W6F5D9_9HYPH|nr:LysR family transcriptional regulator [Methylobacterium brachythecii]MBB3900801.1 DNA-binding transcriptional LysR family regulator [Methylobacterium brachythecii]GLS46389.1 LysR family transcriptional regulator [Methylobacterium brachythecii]